MDKLFIVGLFIFCILLLGKVKRLVKLFVILIIIAIGAYALRSFGFI